MYSRKYRRSSKKSSRGGSKMRGGFTYKKSVKKSGRSKTRNMKSKKSRKSRKHSLRGGVLGNLKKLKSRLNTAKSQVMKHPGIKSSKQSISPQLDTLNSQVQRANNQISSAIKTGANSPYATKSIEMSKSAVQNAQQSMQNIASHPSVVGASNVVKSNVSKLSNSMQKI